MRFYVRTTGERTLHSSYDQIEYTILLDQNHDPVGSFIKQLNECSEACVLLEDDLILCHDFKERILNVINQHPNAIINFFEDPSNYFTSHYKTNFAWNQCTYYPQGVASIISHEMVKIYNLNHDLAYDMIERRALNNLHFTYFTYRPCLVQHLDFKSLIQPMRLHRSTPYFIDYLDKYNIEYENAFVHENLTKLKYEVNALYFNYNFG